VNWDFHNNMAFNQSDMVSGEQYRYALTNFVSLGPAVKAVAMLHVDANVPSVVY
jgi:hypothetical protein